MPVFAPVVNSQWPRELMPNHWGFYQLHRILHRLAQNHHYYLNYVLLFGSCLNTVYRARLYIRFRT